MFYNLVKRNSERNRKENGLFFASLVVSIIAFYIILSLEKQDVIIFLKTMESQAIEKLFLLIPALYLLSLFILFFLVYFAGKYQLDRRSKELGMYLMLGMKRSKLILMLFAEELLNSIISLLIGIPIAIFISEVISLITAKIVGLGIIGHKFSFSIISVIGTIIGYIVIRFLALIILSGRFSKKEVIELLSDSQVERKRKINKIVIIIKLILGILLLGYAFTIAIKGFSWQSLKLMMITVTAGLIGTFLLFQGIGVLFEILLKKKCSTSGLDIFTFRQLQESIFFKSNTLAISALLFIMAISCFAYGIPIGYLNSSSEVHVIDYTFEANKSEVQAVIDKLDLESYIEGLYEMKVGLFGGNRFSKKGLINSAEKLEEGEGKRTLLNNLQYFDRPYLISIDSYNKLLELQGKDYLKLNDNEIALYLGSQVTSYSYLYSSIENALKEMPIVYLDDKGYKLIDKSYSDSIVTDRLINISMGLIVPEDVFNKYTNEKNITTYWNAKLNDEFVNENGLMKAISEVNEKLNTTDIIYESYLQNIARELFYTVAASYTTIYLAVIFLIISNTIMGIQFLIHQQKTRKRYQSLTHMGATYEMLCKSARKQITWYFLLPIVVSVISSLFAVRALFTGLMTISMKEQLSKLMILSIPVLIVICMIELLYIYFVKKNSDRNILKVMDIKRKDN